MTIIKKSQNSLTRKQNKKGNKVISEIKAVISKATAGKVILQATELREAITKLHFIAGVETVFLYQGPFRYLYIIYNIHKPYNTPT